MGTEPPTTFCSNWKPVPLPCLDRDKEHTFAGTLPRRYDQRALETESMRWTEITEIGTVTPVFEM